MGRKPSLLPGGDLFKDATEPGQLADVLGELDGVQTPVRRLQQEPDELLVLPFVGNRDLTIRVTLG